MTTKELYQHAVDIVMKANPNEDINLDKLIELGFSMKDLNEEERSTTRSPNVLYTINNGDAKIEVHYYSYDPTKTFSPIEPDMNKFFVRLFDSEGNKIDEHYTSFQDKPYGAK